MSVIYAAEQLDVGREVAIKIKPLANEEPERPIETCAKANPSAEPSRDHESANKSPKRKRKKKQRPCPYTLI